ncbi:MAG: Tfp pilus assembly protein FimT/FimU [Luteolibacter sp.]
MTPYRHSHAPRGLTLLEMTLVIFLVLTLAGGGLYFGGKIGDWRSGRNAAETLRTVYAAQRMFLSDNPTVKVADLTPEQLIPYLPRGYTAIPTVTSLEGNELEIKITVTPPVVDGGGGAVYDPSGSGKDGLWDIGR